MEVTIGGNRVGSGQKMKAHLHNYFRSTHNLSEKWASSMASGVLYPAMVKLATRGDSFDIEINADARTIPTIGPLFGSYKMQVDVYQIPVRLYQGILHNNPLAIGLKMNQVKFPQMVIGTATTDGYTEAKMNESSLMKYLGLSGLGRCSVSQTKQSIARAINAIPMLAYYDILKTYYANKQEDNAYIISVDEKSTEVGTDGEQWGFSYNGGAFQDVNYGSEKGAAVDTDYYVTIKIPLKGTWEEMEETGFVEDKFIRLEILGESYDETFSMADLYDDPSYEDEYISVVGFLDIENPEFVRYKFTAKQDISMRFTINEQTETIRTTKKLALKPFELANIDDMRYELLSSNTLGTTFQITNDIDTSVGHNYLPYGALVAVDFEGKSYNTYPMNGLALKTYQNDIFNNWLNSEWIEGENGINELSKVSVTDGAFSMDALSFAEKLYNMLNRIAVAGATYEDWQDTVYETVKRRQIESPIFCGGMSQEIMFDEIIQTAPGDGEETGTLGTLGGRGMLVNKKKGGKIHIKCDEASFIMAIVSLTPRIFYTQGNEFYMTEIETMDDLHKPAMDGIGFQDLIGERMAWWDTVIQPSTDTILHRSKIGKLPAWMEYMTSVDKAYGDFALEYGKSSLTLNRNYEHADDGTGIKDATTYVDPQKYNYSFAYQALDAQNFWVMINFNIKARRLMSARLIPNV